MEMKKIQNNTKTETETETKIILKKSNSIGWKKNNIREDYKFTTKLGSGAYGVVY